jgi:hypothetical protein
VGESIKPLLKQGYVKSNGDVRKFDVPVSKNIFLSEDNEKLFNQVWWIVKRAQHFKCAAIVFKYIPFKLRPMMERISVWLQRRREQDPSIPVLGYPIIEDNQLFGIERI